MHRLDDELFELVGARVVEECERRGVDGVFAMIDLHSPHTRSNPRWMLCRRESVIDHASDGKTYNLLAIVFAKIAQVYGDPNRSASGGSVKIVGEVEWRGAQRSENREFIYGFSGAYPDTDYEIVRVAEDCHMSFKDSFA